MANLFIFPCLFPCLAQHYSRNIFLIILSFRLFLVCLFFPVIGLDDIMDEEGVKESGNDTIDEDELVLPNRNLRSRCEETSVTSPRKSPRLMAQGDHSIGYVVLHI